jgi:hypothetical protein
MDEERFARAELDTLLRARAESWRRRQRFRRRKGKPRAVCNLTAGPDKKLPKALALAEARHWMSELNPVAGRIAAM